MILKAGLVALVVALSPFNIDHNLFNGVWVGTSNEDPDNNHSYMRIDDSQSGRFVLVARGKTVYDFEFSDHDILRPEGYLELSKSFGDSGVKIVLSGWVSDEDGGAGLITGVAYMFEAVDGNPKLFNTIFLRLRAVVEPLPSDADSDSTALQRIYDRYSGHESGS